MDEIPDDIRAAAREAVKGRYASGHHAELIYAVCTALMAERERCAKIARRWEESAWRDEVFAARTIADDILKGTPNG